MGNYILTKLLTLPIILIALTIHELSHGFVAYKLGDPTAKLSGRLSLNPLRHIDPIGALCMLLFNFGWARPVPINVRYFKHPKRDMALSALAGPVSNLILGFLSVLVYAINRTIFYDVSMTGFVATLFEIWTMFLYYSIILNVSLAVFNLIPLPPLDGSRIFLIFLPEQYYFKVMRYERYIAIALIVLLYLGFLNGILSTVVSAIVNGMSKIVYLIPFLK